jgi:predicted ATP-grasp superfamily ATP-dependent carboligase
MLPGVEVALRRFRPDRTPALLLGGLNVVRALGLGSIPTVVGFREPDAAVLASRYCSARFPLPPLENRAAVRDALLEAAASLSRSSGPLPLYYGDDDFLDLIQTYRSELAPHCRVLLNDPEIADALIDKDRFEPFALARGLPIPRTLEWGSLDAFDRPVLVKPKVKIDWDRHPVHLCLFRDTGKARVFDNGRRLLSDALAAQLKDDLVVQEYIPGDDSQLWSFHGYADENSELLAWFVGLMPGARA